MTGGKRTVSEGSFVCFFENLSGRGWPCSPRVPDRVGPLLKAVGSANKGGGGAYPAVMPVSGALCYCCAASAACACHIPAISTG